MKKWIVLLLGIIGLLILLPIRGSIQSPFVEVPTPDPKKAVEIADRFGIEPTWDSIYDYVFSKAISPGMSREEVHRVLDKVGPWKIFYMDGPDQGGWDSDIKQYVFSEQIRFLDRDTWLALGDWDFVYDKDGKLVRMEFIDYA